jgi:hypothetical protein
MTIEIKWSFGTSIEWYQDNPECIKPLIDTNYYPYTRLSKDSVEIRKGSTYLKCPAHTDFLKNIFVFRAPFDLTIANIREGQRGEIWSENLTQEQFEKIVDIRFLSGNDSKINPYPIIGIDWLNTFTSTESVLVQLLPAFMHYNDFTNKCTIIPGEYDISKWTRPIELVWEFKNQISKVEIKKGDALCYFKFNCDDIVKLIEQSIPWEESKICADIRKEHPFKPLKERYQQLEEVKANQCPFKKI